MGSTPIHNNIRRLRFDANEMTQAELAERLGVTRQTVLAIEAARYSPTLELAFRIARVFKLPLDAVFQYDERVVAGGEDATGEPGSAVANMPVGSNPSPA